MSDLIERQAAINTIHRMREIWDTGDINDLEEMIVTALAELCPPQRIGHWIEDDDEMFVICSECGEKNDYTSAYCPDCGARME